MIKNYKNQLKVMANSVFNKLSREPFDIAKMIAIELPVDFDTSILDIKIADLQTSRQITNRLGNNLLKYGKPIGTIGDLALTSSEELLKRRSFGYLCLLEVEKLLKNYGLNLSNNTYDRKKKS